MGVMMSLAMMATATASTNRAAVVNGKRGLPQAFLSNFACTPLTPAGAETMQRLKLETLYQVFTTILPAWLDIVESDLLTVGSVDYVVRNVDKWSLPVTNEQFMQLTVEQLLTVT